MTERQYKSLLNFGWNERDIKGRLLCDQIEILNYDFMWRLDNAVTDAKAHYGRDQGRFIVYDFNLDDHNPNGYHPKGRACDGVFNGLNLFQTFLVMDRWRFGGIGLYFDTEPDHMVHVDDRHHFRASRWIRENGGYIYSVILFEKALENMHKD